MTPNQPLQGQEPPDDQQQQPPLPPATALTSDTIGGNPREITIDPMEIQEEYEILPEEGSTLASDDDYRTGRLTQGLGIALQHPDVFNVRTFGAAWLKSMPGISPEEGLAAPPAPPPPPPPKVSINLAIKYETLAPDVQSWFLQQIGAPTHGTEITGAIEHTSKAIQHVGAAADAAAKLAEPAHEAPEPKVPTPKGLGGSQ